MNIQDIMHFVLIDGYKYRYRCKYMNSFSEITIA